MLKALLMSLNGSGRGNQDGPPDLEELMREMGRRFGLLKQTTGDGGNGRPPVVLGGKMIPVFVAIIVILWALSGFYVVDASERGVVLRFGRYVQTTPPGLQWHMPWPIESKQVVNISAVRTIEVGYRGSERNKVLSEALMITDEENIVSVQFAVQYLLKDPVDYLFKDRSPDETVMLAAETAIREVVGKSPMDFVLYEGRDVIAQSTTKLMQDILDRYETGILIRSVTMQSIQPPEQVQGAFDDAVKAGQDRERLKNEAQAYANDIIPRAEGAATRMTLEASAYKESIIAKAEGDVSRFNHIYQVYQKTPQITRERMYLEGLRSVYSTSTKILVDTKGNNMLYLPIDKMIEKTETLKKSQNIETLNSAASNVMNNVTDLVQNNENNAENVLSRSRQSVLSRERWSR